MDLRIKDKVYLVTGGGSGIGGGISAALAREGAIPVLLGRSQLQKGFRAEVLALQPLMHFIQTEMTDGQACAAAVQEAVSMYGRIDGLINCAGGNDNVSLETGVEAFRVSLERNLVHYYTMAHYCIGELKKSKGSILNVSSMWGQIGASCEAAYSATKGAILALTKALAQELGPSGIRVNAVAPGVIQTDMCAHVDPSVMEGLRQQTPIERLGTPEDIARAMVYLADAEFVTGQVLPVNGGFVIT